MIQAGERMREAVAESTGGAEPGVRVGERWQRESEGERKKPERRGWTDEMFHGHGTRIGLNGACPPKKRATR